MATLAEILGTDLYHKGDFKPSLVGDFDVISGVENVRLALLHRLITEPGSLIHRPTYGVGLKQWQNAPSSLGNQRLLAAKIQEQFQEDDRVEQVSSVAMNLDPYEPQKTQIVVNIKLIGYSDQVLEFIPFGETV